MNTVYLSLGTNIGDKSANLTSAISEIEKRIGSVEAQSAFIGTEPWGFESSNQFLNAAVKVNTTLNPYEVLAVTQVIERNMGRTEKTLDGKYHDRLIDIDILLYLEAGKNVTITSPSLTIPHPLMFQRDFVLTPLKEIL